MPEATVEDVEHVILAYFDRHPRAMDTAEGIAEWWLLPIAIQIVQRALERLESRGLVQRCGPAHAPLFRRKGKP
jgi:hypothetical protein